MIDSRRERPPWSMWWEKKENGKDSLQKCLGGKKEKELVLHYRMGQDEDSKSEASNLGKGQKKGKTVEVRGVTLKTNDGKQLTEPGGPGQVSTRGELKIDRRDHEKQGGEK